MAFIGLTDAYNASVCLMYHMFEGEMKEWMFAAHARKAEDVAREEGLEMPERGGGKRVERDYWKKLRKTDDANDWELFTLAKKVVVIIKKRRRRRRRRKKGVKQKQSIEQCPAF